MLTLLIIAVCLPAFLFFLGAYPYPFKNTNLKRMKTETYYGVEFTSLEGMLFSKYLQNESIAMNTKTAKERTKIAKDWLDNRIFKNESDGDRRGKKCQCSKCQTINKCTPHFDFYSTPESNGELLCADCFSQHVQKVLQTHSD